MLISPDSRPRVWLWHLVKHPYFETFIFYMIAVNSVVLILDQPFLENEYTKRTITMLSNVLSAIFIAECVIKIFVMGLICGKTTYLREGFNVLDCCIVLISIADFLLDYFNANFNISFLRAFRALRALRPLKLVSKNEGMRLIVNSLLNSLSGIGNVVLISILLYTVFGILGI
jgi:small-conductance mechanosensitive channel